MCMGEVEVQAARRPAMRDGEVHLWRVGLDLPAAAVAQFGEMLSPDERARAERFRFPLLARRFIAARGALRSILAGYVDADPRELQFRYGAQGKPELASLRAGRRLWFNLSHSDGLAVCAVTHTGPIGVDVERVRPIADLATIAQQFFAPAEVAALMSLPEPHRVVAFFHCWSRKEAYMKAVGTGCTMPLDAFAVNVLPEEPARLLYTPDEPREPTRWTMRGFTLADSFAGAFCVEGAAGSTCVCDLIRMPMAM